MDPEDKATQIALRELRKKDRKALHFIYQTLDEAVFEKVSGVATAKEVWDILGKSYRAVGKAKEVRLRMLRSKFELLQMESSKNVGDYVAPFKPYESRW